MPTKYEDLPEEKKEILRERARANYRKKFITPEQKAERAAKRREALANETPEQRKKRLDSHKRWYARTYNKLSEEEKQTNRDARLLTPEQREQSKAKLKMRVYLWRRARIKVNLQHLEEIRSSTPCVVCGETEPVVLDFHHVQGDNKIDDIARMKYEVSLDTLKSEISKCVVICSNCHRKLHAGIISLELPVYD